LKHITTESIKRALRHKTLTKPLYFSSSEAL